MYEDGWGLQDYLDEAVGEFEAAREWYWNHSEQPILRLAADFTGRQMVAASFSLTDPTPDSENPDVPWEAHQALAKQEIAKNEVNEAIQLELAHLLHADLPAMTERCRALADNLLTKSPGPQVSKFLRRLTRCYVAGFFPECVILCRSVLESAVSELFDSRGVPLPATPQGKSTMRTRLDAAVRLNLLSREATDSAWTVWHRGNTAVHNDIEATSDVLGTLQMTLAVLARIYSKR